MADANAEYGAKRKAGRAFSGKHSDWLVTRLTTWNLYSDSSRTSMDWELFVQESLLFSW
jgi:hypothetical protein